MEEVLRWEGWSLGVREVAIEESDFLRKKLKRELKTEQEGKKEGRMAVKELHNPLIK